MDIVISGSIYGNHINKIRLVKHILIGINITSMRFLTNNGGIRT